MGLQEKILEINMSKFVENTLNPVPLFMLSYICYQIRRKYMEKLKDKSIDLILCDLPYGKTD